MVVGGEGAYMAAGGDEIRSMRGRYASYWTAFLLVLLLLCHLRVN